jgi:hypothetical protein
MEAAIRRVYAAAGSLVCAVERMKIEAFDSLWQHFSDRTSILLSLGDKAGELTRVVHLHFQESFSLTCLAGAVSVREEGRQFDRTQ